MDQEVIYLVHFFFCYAIGGHQVNGVAEGPEVDTARQGIAGDGRADGVDIFVPAGIELEGEDGTQGAGIFYDGVGAEGIEECDVAFGNAVDPVHTICFQGQVQAGEGGGTGERVGGKGVAVEKGFAAVVAKEGVEDLFGGGGNTKRHGSAGEAFAKGDDVGFLLEVFTCEEPAGPAEAGHDLVGYAKDVLPVGFFQQLVEQGGVINVHAAGGLEEGFVDECGDAGTLVADGFAEGVDVFGGWGVDKSDFEEIVAERVGEDAAFADGHSAKRVPVIGVVECENLVAGRRRGLVAPVLDGHFDRDFDGGGAIVGVEDAGELTGQEGEEAFGEVDGGFVGEAGKDHVFKPEGLLVETFGDMGVAMAVDVDPPAADRVDIGFSVVIE